MSQAQEKTWGAGRVQVLASWDIIKEKLQEGRSVSEIYRYLKENNAITIERVQFSRHINQLQTSSPQNAPSPQAFSRPHLSSVVSDRSVGALHTRHSSNDHSSDRHSTNKRPPSFKHNPLPQQDYFASSSKAKGGAR